MCKEIDYAKDRFNQLKNEEANEVKEVLANKLKQKDYLLLKKVPK